MERASRRQPNGHDGRADVARRPPHTADPYEHEAACSAADVIRRAAVRRISHSDAPDRYYSDADNSITIDQTHAAITAATTSSGKSGGHAIIYLEMMRFVADDRQEAHTYMIDLQVDPLRIGIHFAHRDANLEDWLYPGSPLDRLRNLNPQRSRTWQISGVGAMAAYTKALDIKDNIADYRYAYLGRSPEPTHKWMNCARFAEKILKAGGVPLDEASSGALFKIPKSLVTH